LKTGFAAGFTGGIAGIAFGYDGIPERWRNALLERERADELLERLFEVI